MQHEWSARCWPPLFRIEPIDCLSKSEHWISSHSWSQPPEPRTAGVLRHPAEPNVTQNISSIKVSSKFSQYLEEALPSGGAFTFKNLSKHCHRHSQHWARSSLMSRLVCKDPKNQTSIKFFARLCLTQKISSTVRCNAGMQSCYAAHGRSQC